MPLRRHITVLAVVPLALACGDSPSEPQAGQPAAVIIEGNPASTGVGDTVRFAARVVDAAGRRVAGAAVEWRSLDTALAKVDADGLVTGWEGGEARLVAAAGAAADTTTLRVEVLPRRVELQVGPCCVISDDPLYVGRTIGLHTVVRDGRGRALAWAPTFTYASSDTAIATTPATTTYDTYFARSTARRAGTVTFSAVLGDLRAERTVEIVPVGAVTMRREP